LLLDYLLEPEHEGGIFLEGYNGGTSQVLKLKLKLKLAPIYPLRARASYSPVGLTTQ
jgi:hypothetical protein